MKYVGIVIDGKCFAYDGAPLTYALLVASCARADILNFKKQNRVYGDELPLPGAYFCHRRAQYLRVKMGHRSWAAETSWIRLKVDIFLRY